MCLNSGHFTSISNSAAAPCWRDTVSPREHWLLSTLVWVQRVTWTLSFSLKHRGDRNRRWVERVCLSKRKRTNGSPVQITVPVRGWTMTPLQLTGPLEEPASATDTTQQHLWTSWTSMLSALQVNFVHVYNKKSPETRRKAASCKQRHCQSLTTFKAARITERLQTSILLLASKTFKTTFSPEDDWRELPAFCHMGRSREHTEFVDFSDWPE